jgi:hypothetical protein
MFENLKNGWKLGSATRKLIFGDKRLLIYPIIGGLVTCLLALALFVPLALTISSASNTLIVAAVILFGFLSTFVSVYFLVALLLAFRQYSKTGKKMSIADALSQASQYWVQILEWAVFYTIIITILRAIESRMQGIGGFLIGAIGSMALALATIFVVPSIIDNKTGPIKSIESSVKMITKNFGATFGGIIYSDLYALMFIIPGILLFIVGIIVAFTSFIPGIALAIVGVVLTVFGIMLNYVTSNTFIFILYNYVNTGKLPKGFTKDMMDKAIRKKKSSRLTGGFV